MAKKKRTALPRVTLLAYNRRDLLAFVESVEALRLLVDDLRAVARDLGNAAVARSRTRRTNSPTSPPTNSPTSPPTSSPTSPPTAAPQKGAPTRE